MKNSPHDAVTADAAPDLTIELLGAFRVNVGSRQVSDSDWRLRKARGLVKLLSLAPGQQLHRDQLLDALWTDQDPDAAANNLHKAVYTARRALEPDLSPTRPSRYLHVHGEVLSLRSPGTLRIDVDEFEQAAATAVRSGRPGAYDAAVALYAGDLLPEDRYEDWAAARREELRSRHLSLLLTLARMREERGETSDAIEALRRLVAHEPAHEEAHQVLMRLYARAGHRHQALRQYQQLCDVLRRELDVDPAPGSQLLYQEILAGRLAPAPSLVAGPPAQQTRQSPRTEPGIALIGRDSEIEAIEDLLDATFAGHGRLLLLAGEAGIGKSRLVREVAERVRQRGGTVLLGAAYEQEGRLPYGPIAEALEPLGGLTTEGSVRAWLGDNASDVARLSPPTLSALRADRQRLFAAIADLLRRHAAGAPILLALEDLHASDDASLQLLHYLARTNRDSALLILGTFRPEDTTPTSALSGLVDTLCRERLAVRLDLSRLGPRENDLLVAALLDGVPVDRDVSETLFRLAAGNPLYASEVLQALREGDSLRCVDGRWRIAGEVTLPGPLLDLLAGGLERLGPAAMQVLRVAAVAGSEVSFLLLRAASDLPESDLLDALDLCLTRRALLETPVGYRFDHPLRRTAVYEHLGRARRVSLHARVADALEGLHRSDLAGQAEALAHHWAASEWPGRAVPHLVAAGDRAAAVHANEAALAQYQSALDLLNARGAPEDGHRVTAEIWEKVGDLLALMGSAPADAEAFQAALEALRLVSTTEPTHLARLNRKTAFAALARHDHEAAAPYLATAEALLSGLEDTAEWGRVRLIRAIELWARGRHDEGRRAAEESLAQARQRGDDLDLFNAYGTLALVFHSSAAWKASLQLEIERDAAFAAEDPRLSSLFDAHSCLAEYYCYSDTSFEAVEAYADRLLERAARVGARRAEALAWLLRGQSFLQRGRWADAIPCLERTLALQRALGSAPGQVLALQRLAEVRSYQGEHAAAQEHLAAARAITVDPPMGNHVWVRVHATAASHALDHGDLTAAVRAIDAAAETTNRDGSCAVCSALLNPVATRAFLMLGDIDRAEHHAQEAERTAAYWESSTWRALAQVARAGVERARGDSAAASQRFQDAAAAFERLGQPFDAARCLLEAGQTVAEGENAVGARDLIGRALAVFENLGATTAASQARGILDRP